jgi:hypothetical protein
MIVLRAFYDGSGKGEIPAAALNDAVQDPMLLSKFSDWMRQRWCEVKVK